MILGKRLFFFRSVGRATTGQAEVQFSATSDRLMAGSAKNPVSNRAKVP